MMRKLCVFLLIIFIQFSCQRKTALLQSKSINKEVENRNGSKKLLGPINRKGLTTVPCVGWFRNGYENYEVNDETLKGLSPKKLDGIQIQAFMGTWCGDSKREIPRLYKTLDAMGFQEKNLQVIAVDNAPKAYKQSPSHEEEGLNVHRVPTIILYQKGKEIGRIVESPVTSLEKDLAAIKTWP